MNVPEALHENRYFMIEGLISLGGWREHAPPTTKRMFQARYNLDPEANGVMWGIDIDTEILLAIQQEIGAELALRLLQKAADVAPEATSPPALAATDAIRLADEAADELPGECLIFGSPSALIAGGVRKNKQKQFLSAPLLGLGYRTRRGKNALVVNPYGVDHEPVLVCAPGWFNFSYDRVVWTERLRNEATDETSTHFLTDIETNIDATRIRKIPVDIKNW